MTGDTSNPDDRSTPPEPGATDGARGMSRQPARTDGGWGEVFTDEADDDPIQETASDAATDDAADIDSPAPAADESDVEQPTGEDPALRIERLEAENQRLRREYARAKQSQYRRTALGLALIGLLAAAGGLVFPDGRDVLFAFALTGLFASLLTWYLTPSQVVAADVGERVYAAMAENGAALATQLGLAEEFVYLPGGTRPAVLFVPQHRDCEPPDPDDSPLVIETDKRGLLLETAGSFLFEEFDRARSGPLATDPAPLGDQLADAIVEQFELAGAIAIDAEDGRATARVSGSALGAVDRFDHPLAAFLATGFAVGLDRPVSLSVEPAEEYADWLVTCRWASESAADKA